MSLSVWLTVDSFDIDRNFLTELEVYSANITHNLIDMAKQAGLYEALWIPSKLKPLQSVKAKDIEELLEKGLIALKAKPEYYQQFNPRNGWGNYSVFVEWVENYLVAVRSYPTAKIKVMR